MKMRGVNVSAWTEHFEESKESLQRLTSIMRELFEDIDSSVSKCEKGVDSLDTKINAALESSGEDGKLFRAFSITRAYAFLRQQMDGLAGQPEVMSFIKTQGHQDEPNVIMFMLYNVKLGTLRDMAPELANGAEKDYLRFTKNGKTQIMLDSLQEKLDQLTENNEQVAELRDLLRTRKKANKEIIDELFPKFYLLASAYYLAMVAMDVNFVEGPFKAVMIAATSPDPKYGYSRRTLRVLETEFNKYKLHKVDGVRQAYLLALQIASSHYGAAVVESITCHEGKDEDVASRLSLSSQIETLQKQLAPGDTGNMYG